MKVDLLLAKSVSFQNSAWSSLTKEMTIQCALDEIKNGRYFLQIERLRKFIADEKMDQYNIFKKNLPGVTFCGSFDQYRRKEHLKEYNYIIVLDIDKLSTDNLTRVKSILEKDDYVFSFWESPSKKGIKGLVYLSYTKNIDNSDVSAAHKEAFDNLSKYFFEKYQIELDESGSDTTRLCFSSYDPNIITKSDIQPFPIGEIAISAPVTKKSIGKRKVNKGTNKLNALFNPINKNNPNNRKIMQAIIKFLVKRNFSITDTYENWYRVAYAIANTFTFEIGKKYFESLSKMDTEKFNETNCENMLIYCYENTSGDIKFSTIVYLAMGKGYYIKNQREGVPKMADESPS